MIRYDWGLLKKYPVKDILQVLHILECRYYFENQPRKYLKIISKFEDTSSFLFNPVGLIMNANNIMDNDIFVYLTLASMRSYTNYKQTGSLTLPTYYIEHDYNLDKLKLNRCLNVTNEEIIFIYEENTSWLKAGETLKEKPKKAENGTNG